MFIRVRARVPSSAIITCVVLLVVIGTLAEQFNARGKFARCLSLHFSLAANVRRLFYVNTTEASGRIDYVDVSN